MFSQIVYASRAMGETINKLECVRDSSAPTLITDETGTDNEQNWRKPCLCQLSIQLRPLTWSIC